MFWIFYYFSSQNLEKSSVILSIYDYILVPDLTGFTEVSISVVYISRCWRTWINTVCIYHFDISLKGLHQIAFPLQNSMHTFTKPPLSKSYLFLNQHSEFHYGGLGWYPDLFRSWDLDSKSRDRSESEGFIWKFILIYLAPDLASRSLNNSSLFYIISTPPLVPRYYQSF